MLAYPFPLLLMGWTRTDIPPPPLAGSRNDIKIKINAHRETQTPEAGLPVELVWRRTAGSRGGSDGRGPEGSLRPKRSWRLAWGRRACPCPRPLSRGRRCLRSCWARGSGGRRRRSLRTGTGCLTTRPPSFAPAFPLRWVLVSFLVVVVVVVCFVVVDDLVTEHGCCAGAPLAPA